MVVVDKIKEILREKETQQFIRFCVVGLFCFIIDNTIFMIMRERFGFSQDVSHASGFLISLSINYLLTIYWTFQTNYSVQNGVGVVAVHIFNFVVVRRGLLSIFTVNVGLDESFAYPIMVMISAVINYILIRTVVKYSKRKQAADAKEQKI